MLCTFQAFNWLVRSVTQPTCLHDLLWFFVASLAPCVTEYEEEEAEVDNRKDRRDQEQVGSEGLIFSVKYTQLISTSRYVFELGLAINSLSGNGTKTQEHISQIGNV